MTTQVALVMAPLLPWIRSTGVENMGWKYGGGFNGCRHLAYLTISFEVQQRSLRTSY